MFIDFDTKIVIIRGVSMLIPELTREGFELWVNCNLFIQEALPLLSPIEREFLLSGRTKEEYEADMGVEL